MIGDGSGGRVVSVGKGHACPLMALTLTLCYNLDLSHVDNRAAAPFNTVACDDDHPTHSLHHDARDSRAPAAAADAGLIVAAFAVLIIRRLATPAAASAAALVTLLLFLSTAAAPDADSDASSHPLRVSRL
jgi:hypothetical protein